MERIGLKPEVLKSFNVTVVDGEKIFGNTGCLNIQLMIQGHATIADLLVVPLGNSQVVLGTIWLKSIGPTSFSYCSVSPNSILINFIIYKEEKFH